MIRPLLLLALLMVLLPIAGCSLLPDYGADVQIVVVPAVGAKWISPPVVATELRERLRRFRIAANVEALKDGSLQVTADARARAALLHLLPWDGGLYFSRADDATAAGSKSQRLHMESTAMLSVALSSRGREARISVAPEAFTAITAFAMGATTLDVDLGGGHVGSVRPLSGDRGGGTVADRADIDVYFGGDIAAFTRAAEFVRLLRAPPVPGMRVAGVTRIPLGVSRAAMVFVLPFVISLGWLFFVRRFDRMRPEPLATVAATFALGLLSALPAWGIEYYAAKLSPFLNPQLMTLGRQSAGFPVGLCSFTIAVGLVEEGVKLLAVLGFARRKAEFDEPVDGIVYAAAASLGFAAVENIHVFAQGDLSSGGFAVRAMMTVPAHLFFSSIWGFALGKTLVSRRARLLPAFAAAALAHGAFDAALSVRHMKPLAIALCVALAFLFTHAVRTLLRDPGPPKAGSSDEPLLSSRPRIIVPIRNGGWASAYGATLALSAGAVVYLAGTVDTGAHQAAPESIAACLLLCSAMSFALYEFANAIPIDLAIDAHGVTWSGRMVAWRHVIQVEDVEELRGHYLKIVGDEAPLLIGPGSRELLGAARRQISDWQPGRAL